MCVPMFSVVIATCNRERLLKRALQSVARQTMDNYEIVVVDDASSDGTSLFLKTVASDRCKTFRNDQRLGISGSRNRGAAAARGEFIVYLDDDDQLRPTALRLLREEHLAHPELDFFWGGRAIHQKDLAGYHITSQFDDWSSLPHALSGSQFLAVVLDIATNAAFTIRRTVLQALGGFDERLKISEDRDLFIRLARGGYAGCAVTSIIIDVDSYVNGSLSRQIGRQLGPAMDLIVIDKHRQYLERPEHQEVINRYLREVFGAYLEANDRRSAWRIVTELRKRGGLKVGILRMYLRHASEFRLLKKLLCYDRMRRFAARSHLTPDASADESAMAHDLNSRN